MYLFLLLLRLHLHTNCVSVRALIKLFCLHANVKRAARNDNEKRARSIKCHLLFVYI